jgi:signal transduction histidine kinase
LGLPICRDIVQAHTGDIWVDASERTGTTVTVWIPEPEELAT